MSEKHTGTKNCKTNHWQALPTCLKMTAKQKKRFFECSEEFKCDARYLPSSSPGQASAWVVSALPQTTVNWTNSTSCFLSMENNWTLSISRDGLDCKRCLKYQSLQLNSLYQYHNRLLWVDSLPRAVPCTAKYIRARKKKIHLKI